VPEGTIAFANGTIKSPPAGTATVPDQELRGFKLDLGARAGAEIHFGFIGIPQLSLQVEAPLILASARKMPVGRDDVRLRGRSRLTERVVQRARSGVETLDELSQLELLVVDHQDPAGRLGHQAFLI